MYSWYIYHYIDVDSCPSTYPFAFANGKKCCKHDKDVDHRLISIGSSSCKNNGFINCPVDQCETCSKCQGTQNLYEGCDTNDDGINKIT